MIKEKRAPVDYACQARPFTRILRRSRVALRTQECYAFSGNLSYITQREPYEITNEHLKTFGVKVVSPTLDPLMLECLKCEERFMVLRWADGNLPKQWWICRNGCNQQDAA